MPIKVLFLSAQTRDANDVGDDEEYRAIDTATGMGRVELASGWAVRIDDLMRLLNRHQPDVVHFAGHGDGRGGFVMRDAKDASRALGPADLTAVLSSFTDTVSVVVLNACYSAALAEAIVEHVPCAIGTRMSIANAAARSFASAFYDAINSDRSVGNAFGQARTAVHVVHGANEDVAEIFAKPGVDVGELVLRTTQRVSPPQTSLAEFLVERFTPDAFRRFIAPWAEDRVVLPERPLGILGDLRLLSELGHLDAGFIDALSQRFPEYRVRIQQLDMENPP